MRATMWLCLTLCLVSGVSNAFAQFSTTSGLSEEGKEGDAKEATTPNVEERLATLERQMKDLNSDLAKTVERLEDAVQKLDREQAGTAPGAAANIPIPSTSTDPSGAQYQSGGQYPRGYLVAPADPLVADPYAAGARYQGPPKASYPKDSTFNPGGSTARGGFSSPATQPQDIRSQTPPHPVIPADRQWQRFEINGQAFYIVPVDQMDQTVRPSQRPQ